MVLLSHKYCSHRDVQVLDLSTMGGVHDPYFRFHWINFDWHRNIPLRTISHKLFTTILASASNACRPSLPMSPVKIFRVNFEGSFAIASYHP